MGLKTRDEKEAFQAAVSLWYSRSLMRLPCNEWPTLVEELGARIRATVEACLNPQIAHYQWHIDGLLVSMYDDYARCLYEGVRSGAVTGRGKGAHSFEDALSLNLDVAVESILEMGETLDLGTSPGLRPRVAAARVQWEHKMRAHFLRQGEVTEQPSPAAAGSYGATKWADVCISIFTDEVAGVQILNQKPVNKTFLELGFARQPNGEPNKCWALLKVLAKKGTLWPQTRSGPKYAAFEKNVSRTRKALRDHFGITGNPIRFVKGSGYEATFILRDRRPSDC